MYAPDNLIPDQRANFFQRPNQLSGLALFAFNDRAGPVGCRVRIMFVVHRLPFAIKKHPRKSAYNFMLSLYPIVRSFLVLTFIVYLFFIIFNKWQLHILRPWNIFDDFGHLFFRRNLAIFIYELFRC